MDDRDVLGVFVSAAGSFVAYLGHSLSKNGGALIVAGFSEKQAKRLKELCGENPQNYYCELLGLWCVLESMDDQMKNQKKIFSKLVEFGNTEG